MFFKFSGKPVNTTYKMPETAFGMELPYIKMFGPFEGV
jgi:hypothetical protein